LERKRKKEGKKKRGGRPSRVVLKIARPRREGRDLLKGGGGRGKWGGILSSNETDRFYIVEERVAERGRSLSEINQLKRKGENRGGQTNFFFFLKARRDARARERD